jgi:phage regulator Rha-like protein
MDIIPLHPVKNEARVDSRVLADKLQNQHKNVLSLIDNYKSDFEEFGAIAFKTLKGKPLPQGGNAKPARYTLLNEDQAYLLLSFSKNTNHVRGLKVELVKAFSRFRQHKQAEADYLPYYHELHDEVKVLALQAHQAGSNTKERIFHINFNKLINSAFGLKSGQRQNLPGHLRAKVTTANVIASELLKGAIDNGMTHKQAFQHVKQGIIAFANASTGLLEVA